MKTILLLSALSLPLATPALAKPAATLTLAAQNHDFSDARGPLRTVRLEYRRDLGRVAIAVAPTWAEQRLDTALRHSAGADGALDLRLSDRVSTHTTLAVAENDGIVPRLELGQDVSLTVMPRTVATVGLRRSRYQNEDVTFLHAGLRRYFRGGSLSYRLTRTTPERGGAFLAHLANLVLNDARGEGRTQVWLGYGASADNRLPGGQSLSGKDWSLSLRRVQPVGGGFALAPLAGYASYDLPGGRVSSLNLGLGLSLAMN